MPSDPRLLEFDFEHVQGSEGYSDIGRFRIESENGSWAYRHSKKDKNPYQQEHNDLFHAVRNDLPCNEASIGAKTTLSAIMGRIASHSGQQVIWDEALASRIPQADEQV